MTSRILPSFALPRLVLFPGVRLPLHLFENRYRAMAEHVLASAPHYLVVAQLVAENAGVQTLQDVGTLARIVAHEKKENGTYDVILVGEERVRVSPGPTGMLYPCVAIDSFEWSGVLAKGDRTALLVCAERLATVVRKQHPDFSVEISPTDPDVRVVDLLADRFIADSEVRAKLLREPDLGARGRQVLAILSDLMALLQTNLEPS